MNDYPDTLLYKDYVAAEVLSDPNAFVTLGNLRARRRGMPLNYSTVSTISTTTQSLT